MNLQSWKVYYQRPSTDFWPFKPVKYTHSYKRKWHTDVYFQSTDHDPEKEMPRIFCLTEETFTKWYNTDV